MFPPSAATSPAIVGPHTVCSGSKDLFFFSLDRNRNFGDHSADSSARRRRVAARFFDDTTHCSPASAAHASRASASVAKAAQLVNEHGVSGGGRGLADGGGGRGGGGDGG